MPLRSKSIVVGEYKKPVPKSSKMILGQVSITISDSYYRRFTLSNITHFLRNPWA